MAEEKSEGIRSTVSGWIKAGLTSVVGLLSGAILMYLTPLVNNAIKPAKPVANFASQVDGLNVKFNNRSTGASQGWWDFGDGSALEPFDPKAEMVPHKYDKPGSYSVKLTLQNLIGDESDRTVPVNLDDSPTTASAAPAIGDFQLTALTPGERAPAAYQLKSKVKAGTKCILSYGDDRPLEIVDASGSVERLLYFPEMGAYTVRLAAFDGKQLIEQKQTVYVSPNDSADPVAKLVMNCQAVRVERSEHLFHIHCGWQPDIKDSVCPFRKERPADFGCTIVSAELVSTADKNGVVRNPSVTIAPDKSKLILSGDLVKPTGVFVSKTAPPHWLAQVKVVMERRSAPQPYNPGEVMVTVKPGSTTMIPMQPLDPGLVIVQQDVSLELWDGSRKAWQGSSAVTAAPVTLSNKPCFVTAALQKDGFLLKIDMPSPGPAPISMPPPIAPTPPTPITMPATPITMPPIVAPAPTPILTPAPIVTPLPAPIVAPLPALDLVSTRRSADADAAIWSPPQGRLRVQSPVAAAAEMSLPCRRAEPRKGPGCGPPSRLADGASGSPNTCPRRA